MSAKVCAERVVKGGAEASALPKEPVGGTVHEASGGGVREGALA